MGSGDELDDKDINPLGKTTKNAVFNELMNPLGITIYY